MEKVTLSRKELYDLVWSQSMTSLMKKYQVPYSDFKRICEQMNIPIPKTGHWMKIMHGKPVEVEALPAEYNGENEITFVHKAEEEGAVPSLSIKAIKQREIESNLKALVIQSELKTPDRLIAESQNAVKKYEKDYERVRKNQDWEHLTRPSNILDIHVSKEQYDRAIRFMDAFIKLLRTRGHDMICDNGTYMIVYGERMKISLVERMKREMVVNEKTNWKEAKNSYSGVLLIRYKECAYRTIDWAERKQPIEMLLPKIMANIELKAQEIKKERIELEERWAEQAKKRKVEEEYQSRVAKELDDFKKLIAEAERWYQVKKIRSYIDDVEAKSKNNQSDYEETKKWIVWARKKAEWYEPKSKMVDDLLSKEDITLVYKRVSLV
jgi:hypothetical protein